MPSTLYEIRKARTLSQAQMADLLGITQQAYSLYETGERTPNIGQQARIAAILNAPVIDLFPVAVPAEK
jgi:transcriptional regulator with XRE-family HTH domain